MYAPIGHIKEFQYDLSLQLASQLRVAEGLHGFLLYRMPIEHTVQQPGIYVDKRDQAWFRVSELDEVNRSFGTLGLGFMSVVDDPWYGRN